MDCKKDGYCLKIYQKTNRKVFVDDRYCKKCQEQLGGNPKMPRPINKNTIKIKQPVSPEEQNRRWKICEDICKDNKCICSGKLKKKIIYGDCEKFH